MTTDLATGDNRGIIAGRDIIDANLVNTGDVTGSYNAIGVGAQMVINQIHQARSAIEELAAELRLAEAQLADAVARKLQQLTAAVEKTARLGRRNPYRSLLDYRLEDAPFFYGRDDAITDLLGKIHDHRFTVLHAESGAGKSSLLQAGLAARLLAAGHLPLRLRPYREDPTNFIKRAFLPNIDAGPELDRFRAMPLAAFLQSVTAYLGDSTLYIFLDQFEEFFTELPANDQERFAGELADCLDDSGLDVRWVLSLRKEYFSDLNLFRPRIAPFENEYFLAAFQANEARTVIVQPATKHGVGYESELLVDTMLVDLTEEDGRLQPPQVQLVCYELFEDVLDSTPSDLITAALYEQPRGRGQGGAQGILSNHLNRVLERMSADDRRLARSILEAQVSSQGRRVRVAQGDLIAQIRQRDPASAPIQVDVVVKQLVDSRLLRSDEDENDEPVYELAHDYLLAEIEVDPELLAQKAAQELLNQEVVAYKQFGTLLSRQKFAIIDDQRVALSMDAEGLELLAQSEATIRTEEQAKAASQQRVLNRTRLFFIAAIFALLFAIIAAVPTIQDRLRRREARSLSTLMYIASSTAPLGDAVLNRVGLALPERQYEVSSFKIEDREVSIERYLLCVKSKACSRPNVAPKQYEASERRDYPVTDVTLYQASEFCSWIKRRLPTAIEWERVARGVDGRPWPWGVDPAVTASQAVFTYDSSAPAFVQPILSADRGASAEGAYDLAGNVWEWTSTYLDDESKERLIVKGGSAMQYAIDLQSMAEHETAPGNYHSGMLGFRCATSK